MGGGAVAGICLVFYEEVDAILDIVFGNSFVYSNIFITPETLLKDQVTNNTTYTTILNL